MEAHKTRQVRLRAIQVAPPPIKNPIAKKGIDPAPFWPQMWMWDLIEWRQKGRPHIKAVIEITARHFDISPDELISPCRSASICIARQIAMYLSRKVALRSSPEIGRKFGDRDHTTVLYAERKIARLLACDSDLKINVSEIRRKLGC